MIPVTSGMIALKKKRTNRKLKLVRGGENPFFKKLESISTTERRVVSCTISVRAADHLHLLSIYKNRSIQDMLRHVLNTIMSEGESENEILTKLAHMGIDEWNIRKDTHVDDVGWKYELDRVHRYKEYEYEIRLSLLRKNISESVILRILKRMKDVLDGEI